MAKKRKPGERTQKQTEPGDTTENTFDYLTSKLDRTAHPEISSAPRVLERALWLLRVSRDHYEIDGVGATQIAKLLTDKFRLRTTRQAVQQALDPARDYVDRHSPQSGRVIYRIMHGGEVYLDSLGSKEEKPSNVARGVRSAKKSKNKTPKLKQAREKKTSAATTVRVPAKASSTKGAAAILSDLMGEGFFKEPRTIRGIIDHAKADLGYHLKANELSPPLLRALRNRKLKRAQNSEQQYEYSEA